MSKRRDDFQLNNKNMNSENTGNPGGDFNMNDFNKFLNNVDLNQLMGQLSRMMGGSQGNNQNNQGGNQGEWLNGAFQSPRQSNRDPRIQLMQALKPFLNKRRATMLDNIGQLYNIYNIIKSMNKKR